MSLKYKLKKKKKYGDNRRLKRGKTFRHELCSEVEDRAKKTKAVQ